MLRPTSLQLVSLVLLTALPQPGCQGKRSTDVGRSNAATTSVPSSPAATAHSQPPGHMAQRAKRKKEREARQTKATSARAAKYGVPLRSPAALSRLLKTTCEASVKDHKPIIVDVGADWCSDCARLHQSLKDPALQSELENWHLVEVNLGDEQHTELQNHFKIRAIPKWFLLKPLSCEAPVTQWPLMQQRLLEKTPTPAALSQWLKQSRQG